MHTKLTWFGHATWQIETGGLTLLLDPFFTDNPATMMRVENLHPHYLLISHGHFDHVADAEAIAKRSGATVIANYEICDWYSKRGVAKTEPMNLGGGIDLPFGRVYMTLAYHSSTLPDGSSGGSAAGFVLALPNANVYFACDTALFGDMKLIGSAVYRCQGRERAGLDVAVLPIGDRFTMGPHESCHAAQLLHAKQVVASHYDTWPPIAQDAEQWKHMVERSTSSEAIALQPGESLTM